MKNSTDYIQQAAHNAELAAYLRHEKSAYIDWAATCLFYAAVHYVNAYLVHFQKTLPRRHKTQGNMVGRSNIVQADPALSQIYPDYRHLDDESRDARYELKKPSADDYDKFLLSRLDKIRKFILPKVTN